MSILIVHLPLALSTNATAYDHVLSSDGSHAQGHARASADLLPAADEVVAMVPAQALSWHQVVLPKGALPRSAVVSGAPALRLQAILEGLLEDRLLDDTTELHFALEPGPRTGLPVWVAVCDRGWLQRALQPLEDARRVVARIVPELAPHAAPSRLRALGPAEHLRLAASGEHGVTVLPLTAEVLPLLARHEPAVAEAAVTADPVAAGQAEQVFGRPVQLQPEAERWLEAARSPWDLAQFGLVASQRARAWKQWAAHGRQWLQAPRWRAARWALGLCVAANLLGLQAWAWKERAALDDKREAVRQTLLQTFPGVRVVVDAPLQMEREVALLRQGSGAASGRDLEALLGAAGSVLPEAQTPSAIEFANGELQLRGVALPETATAALGSRLRGQGYGVRVEGERLFLRPEAAP